MKLENQVPSLALCKRLKELGYPQESLFKFCGGYDMYFDNEDGEFEECKNTDILGEDEYCHTAGLTCEYFISAPTVAELGEALKHKDMYGHSFLYIHYAFPFGDGGNVWSMWLEDEDGQKETLKGLNGWSISDKSEANVRAKMLIYLLENKIINLPSSK